MSHLVRKKWKTVTAWKTTSLFVVTLAMNGTIKRATDQRHIHCLLDNSHAAAVERVPVHLEWLAMRVALHNRTKGSSAGAVIIGEHKHTHMHQHQQWNDLVEAAVAVV